jgi:hypothetical protein
MATGRRSYRWVWFFVVLAVLGVLGVGLQIRHKMAQQLRPEKLAAARARWQEQGPKNYRLQYTQKVSTPETFVVWVRNGRVLGVVRKLDPKAPDQDGEVLPGRLFAYHSMEALFDHIEQFVQMKGRTFMIADFDPEDGHLQRFVRRVARTSERQEITDVKLEPTQPGDPLPGFLP